MPEQLLSFKSPPHSIDAEQAVLGALILNNEAWDGVAEQLRAEDFYRQEHRRIFTAMERQIGAGHPIDLLTLSQSLAGANELENAGGFDYLGELVSNTPGAANISAYADIIRERAILRELIKAANAIADDCYNPEGKNSAALLDQAEQRVFRIADERPRGGGPQPLNALLKQAQERVDALSQAKGGITGLDTGFLDLNEMTSGLQRSDLIIVAGRPSMGKTSLAMNMVEHAILNQALPVLVFSLEMPASSLILRMLSSLGKISQSRVREGRLNEDEWESFAKAVGKLENRPLFIDDSSALSPMDMRSRVRRMVREHGKLGLVVVDYLQLMEIRDFRENRTMEISQICRELKIMAREFECPVLALSQLNRSLEARTNKRPMMSDLRESGSIEQDADLIMFIYREEYYESDSEKKGMAEIIIAKQRNGPVGTKVLSFLEQFTRFENFQPAADADYHYHDGRDYYVGDGQE